MELRIVQLAFGLRGRHDLRFVHLHAKLPRDYEYILRGNRPCGMERHHGQIPHGGADDRIRRHHGIRFHIRRVHGILAMFPNFTIALPIQMLIVAPLSGKIVHAIGDAAGWNKSAQQHVPALDVKTVADVMQHDVYTVASDAEVRDAVRMMLEKNISGMPIVDDERHVVGFISDSDVLRRFAQDNAPVSDISTLVTGMARGEFPELSHAELLDMNVMVIAAKPAVTVQSDANIAQVCQMFGYQQYKKVPVVEQGKLVGVVNRRRLTRRSFEACLGTAE